MSMLFERQLGELLFTPIKKLLNQPIKYTLFMGVCASYILTFLADSPTPHTALLKNIKEYFAGWSQFVITWDSLIVNSLSLICFVLFIITIINFFQDRSSELLDFIFQRWMEKYIEVSILYTGILVLIEPSFDSFVTHAKSNYYGAIETFSIASGFWFTLASCGVLMVRLLRNEGLFLF